MKIPSPQEVGLPEKFTSWRANQEHSLDVMITSKRRITALSAPTGFGKSPTYIAWALMTGKPTCIVTNSRGLQDQLMRDYESIGLVDIRGRNNYPCEYTEYSCAEGYAAHCPYKGTVGCPASCAEARAESSGLVVTNYDKWIAAKRFGRGFDHFEQVVFDEGHEAPEAVAKAMQVHLGHKEIEDSLEMDFPESGDDSMTTWRMWASGARYEAEKALEACKIKIQDTPSPKSSWLKELVHLQHLCRRLATLATARPQDWVVESIDGGYQFDPIRPARYAESTLLLRVPRIIIVSATLRPKSLFMLGLGRESFDFYEFDSDFPRERCPIYWVPTMRVDVRAGSLAALWARLDQIIARRRDRKGIVHTVSYTRRDEVVAHSRFAPYMLINTKGEPSTATVEAFKLAPPGTILVSPSVGTGYDFPGKDCEYQFITKIPFPDQRSKIMKARQEDDRELAPYMAMQSLVQAAGRAMRSKEDQAETFLGDDHLSWFLPKYGHLAPRTFHSMFQKVNILPQPPPPLS